MSNVDIPQKKTENEIRLEAMLIEAIRQRDLCYSTGDDLVRMAGELAVLKSKISSVEATVEPAKT